MLPGKEVSPCQILESFMSWKLERKFYVLKKLASANSKFHFYPTTERSCNIRKGASDFSSDANTTHFGEKISAMLCAHPINSSWSQNAQRWCTRMCASGGKVDVILRWFTFPHNFQTSVHRCKIINTLSYMHHSNGGMNRFMNSI